MYPEPHVMDHEILQPDGSPMVLRGQLLGFATSHRDYHNHSIPEDSSKGPRDLEKFPSDWKCSGCRWFEVSIIWDVEDKTYAVYTVGKSAIPGEEARPVVRFTQSPLEILEILTDKRGNTPRLPDASARCIAQAADADQRIRDAYVNRAVF